MKLSAVLLAGGESTRMGCDKATVIFRNHPLWQHQIDLLKSLRPIEILVSARTDPAWRPADSKFVPDSPPSSGPLSGLVAALGSMNGTHLLALAIDMPLLTKPHLERMYDFIRPGRGVLPKFGTRAEPLAAIFPSEGFAHLSAALGSRELSLQRITDKMVRQGLLAVLELSPADQEYYRSLNLPADLGRSPESAQRQISR